MISIILLLLQTISSHGQEPYTSTKICSEKTTALKVEAFVQTYNLEKPHEKMKRLSNHLNNYVFPEKIEIKEKLLQARKNYVESHKALDLFLKIIDKLNLDTKNEPALILNSYMAEYRDSNNKINLDITDIDDLDHKGKADLREVLRVQLLKDLRNKYESVFSESVSANPLLSRKEKAFLKEWTFSLIPTRPVYQWTEAATSLHRHLWDGFYNSNVFKEPAGKHNNSSYWLESFMNTQTPGLNLNLAFRETLEDLEVTMNLKFIFTPFNEGEILLEICDFENSENTNSCESVTIEDWCSSKK